MTGVDDIPTIDPDAVSRRSAELRERVARVADGRAVDIVAVTKGFGVDAPRAALANGFVRLGENYAQELLAKDAALDDDERSRVEWQFLGRLQRNKIRLLAAIVGVWQSIDRAELVDELAKRVPGAVVMIQANLSGEAQKGGASLDLVPTLVDRARAAGLEVRGLMGVGPAGDPDLSRPGFRALVALADRLAVPERSIGMSDDLEVAIEEGATVVRVGSALFGSRPLR
jgi:pyridoxal phosphate enzyme (YggS family)